MLETHMSSSKRNMNGMETLFSQTECKSKLHTNTIGENNGINNF